MTAKAFGLTVKKGLVPSSVFTQNFIISGNENPLLEEHLAVTVTSESKLPSFSIWASWDVWLGQT